MIRSALTAAMLSLSLVTAQAQAPAAAPPPIEDFFKNPAIAGPQLSPNGKYLAVLTPVGGRMNLAVVDLETRKGTAITNISQFDVLSPRWIGNDRLIFSVGQQNSPTGAGQYDGGGLFVVSRDGKESRQLSKTVREIRASGQYVYRPMEFLRRIPGTDEEILVSANLRSVDAKDVYRLNLRNGRTSLVSSVRPERTDRWILDRQGTPRVVQSTVKDTTQEIWHYRKDANAPWTEIARVDSATGPSFTVLGVFSDNKTLMVAGNPGGRDTMAVYRFDPETKQFGELLAQHPRYDMGADGAGQRVPGVVVEPESDRVTGYSVAADKPQTVWLDEKEAKTQAAIDGALPDTHNTFERFPNSARVLVTSYSDVQPPRWYLLDEEKRTLEELFSSRPWITKAHRVQQRSFLFKTRDGLEIPGYYFLPQGYKPGDKLPTVVHIHGGPFARADFWGSGFGVLEGQLLASRGYAVVVPNFRITPGLGTRLYYAGMGTIGRQMSEDHEDAAAWAVKEGFADPKRMCISGASYGGYATLWALAKTPDLFKCGIAGLVVSDLDRALTSPAGDTASNEEAVQYWRQVAGVKQNPNALRDYSPVRAAAKIKAPLFMYAGADDIRTPLEQTSAMISALESAGNPPKDVVIKKEEGHGFGKVENNVDLYTRILKFLDEQIGSKSR